MRWKVVEEAKRGDYCQATIETVNALDYAREASKQLSSDQESE